MPGKDSYGAELHLRREKRFLEHVINQLSSPLFVKDEEHRWVLLNDAACRMMGRPREELLGCSDYDIFPAEQADVFWQKDREVLETGRSDTNEELITWHGRIRTILTVKSLYQDTEDGRRYIVGAITDITDRRRSEDELRSYGESLESMVAERTRELTQANDRLTREILRSARTQQALERVAHAAAHDLRSPLITISGFMDVLAQQAARGDQADMPRMVERCQVAADRMIGLLGDLQQILQAGEPIRSPAPVPIREILRELEEQLGPALSEAGIRLDVAEDLPVVPGDRKRLTQVFRQLLENAMQHMGEPPEPRLKVGSCTCEGEQVTYVRNNGLGIEPRYHLRVFDQFEQLDPAAQGSGVGLTLVKRIVEAHGGLVWVESEGSGKGCDFRVFLPPGPQER